jgi:hypothetical protein
LDQFKSAAWIKIERKDAFHMRKLAWPTPIATAVNTPHPSELARN